MNQSKTRYLLTSNGSNSIQTLHWTFALISLLATFLFFMFRYSLWQYWGVQHFQPIFLDMHAILSAADAYRDGYNVFLENPYDVLNRVHIYSRVWLWIGHFGITRYHNTLVGAIVVTSFLSLSVALTRPRNLKEFLFSSMLILSPAVMLGVERANNDLVIFILLAIAILSLFSNVRGIQYSSFFFIFLASILKFYPIVSFVVYVRHIDNNRKFWMIVLLASLSWGAFVWWSFDDFVILQKTVIQPYARGTFGAVLLFCWLLLQWPINKIPYIITVCIVITLSFILSSKFRTNKSETNSVNNLLFLTGSLCLAFCFFAFTNFDYRCIFFILTLPYFFQVLRCKDTPPRTHLLIHLFFLLLIVVVWNELPLYYVESITKMMNIYYLNSKIIYTAILIEHFCTWIVITILLIFSIDIILPAFNQKFFIPCSLKKRRRSVNKADK